MNWLMIIILVLMLWRIVSGVDRGLIKELLGFVGMLFLGTAIGLILVGVEGYFQEDIIQMTITIVLIVLLAIVHSILKLVVFPARVIAKIPVINIVDKLCGILFGVLEICIVFWVICFAMQYYSFGSIGAAISVAIEESPFLLSLREMNLITWVVDIAKENIIEIAESL